MPAAPIPVLFVHYGEQWIRGSEQLLLDLMRRLDPARARPLLWTNVAAMDQAARAAGIASEHEDFAYYLDAGSPRLDPVRFARLVRRGVGLIRRHGASVVHANSAAPVQWMLPAARLTRRRILVHLHSSYLRRSRVVLGLRHVDLAVGCSASVLEGLRGDGMAERRLRVIHNGIDTARLDRADPAAAGLRARLGIPAEALLIGAIGSLIRRKGVDLLLRALAAPGLEAARLAVAGEGPEREALEALAASLGVADRVAFLGYADPGPLYAAADIVALASRAEALPLVLLEAAMLGRPVVAADVGGVAEAVAAGETGLLVPQDDVAALAAALARLAADPALRARMGAAAAARARAMFGLEAMVAAFAGVYRDLAGG